MCVTYFTRNVYRLQCVVRHNPQFTMLHENNDIWFDCEFALLFLRPRGFVCSKFFNVERWRVDLRMNNGTQQQRKLYEEIRGESKLNCWVR